MRCGRDFTEVRITVAGYKDRAREGHSLYEFPDSLITPMVAVTAEPEDGPSW